MTRVGVSITLEQAAALTASVDGNGDGLIDFDEFVIMMQDLPDAKVSQRPNSLVLAEPYYPACEGVAVCYVQ